MEGGREGGREGREGGGEEGEGRREENRDELVTYLRIQYELELTSGLALLAAPRAMYSNVYTEPSCFETLRPLLLSSLPSHTHTHIECQPPHQS